MLFKWPYFCLCSTLEDKLTNRENKLATLYLDSKASRPSALGPSLPFWNRILISTRKYGCLWKPILSTHNDNNLVWHIVFGMTYQVLYMSYDKCLLTVESCDLCQADKSIIRGSSFPNFTKLQFLNDEIIWRLALWQNWCFGQFYHSKICKIEK